MSVARWIGTAVSVAGMRTRAATDLRVRRLYEDDILVMLAMSRPGFFYRVPHPI